MQVRFAKYHGAGNDFIIIDDRATQLSLSSQTIAQWCHRRTGIGADGLILLRSAPPPLDFEMIYFNADGKIATFCGNGGRCIADFAHRHLKAAGSSMNFRAADGNHQATILPAHRVRLEMQDVPTIHQRSADFILNTGSPHFVRWVTKLADYPVTEQGRQIRHLPQFEPQGINVNFIERAAEGLLNVRTYERGVEAETLACGTGVVAAAIAASGDKTGQFAIELQTRNGDTFDVAFEKVTKDHARHITLTGPVCFVYDGLIEGTTLSASESISNNRS